MATQPYIRSPIEWGWDHLRRMGYAMDHAARAIDGTWDRGQARSLAVRRISVNDLWASLRKGMADFGAYRTDVIFLCLAYPTAGLILSRLALGSGMLPLLFPLISGFAIVAPFFAVGLYEMSRRRELGLSTGWSDAFGVATSPALGSILVMGLLLAALLALWLLSAHLIYLISLGPQPPDSLGAFAEEILTTKAGWTMVVVGMVVGFLFALAAATISVVSFPLLLDQNVGVRAAIATSVRAIATNPGAFALWGLIIVAGLAIGAIPFLLGLAVVLPVLGHATWHLYRAVVPPEITTG